MKGNFMLLVLLEMLYQIHCSNMTVIIRKCSPRVVYLTCSGDNFDLTDFQINNLPFVSIGTPYWHNKTFFQVES